VTVSAKLGNPVVLTVHDDGPGFPDGLAATAFERFTRGDTARSREESGAGLGLSLVQAIVDAHHGQVTLDSRPGSTTFTVELPASNA
jgi:two-component system OmpR family sensor kinase